MEEQTTGMKKTELVKHKKAIQREIPPKYLVNIHENYKKSNKRLNPNKRNFGICITLCLQKDVQIALSFMCLFSCTVQIVENNIWK